VIRRTLAATATVLVAISLAACGSLSATSTSPAPGPSVRPATRAHRSARIASAIPSGDWPQFDFTAQRSGAGPADTGITAADASTLRLRTVALPGTADSSAIELHGVAIKGKARDVLFLTTSYGQTLAIDAETGRTLWEYTPKDFAAENGSGSYTNATPTADPDLKYIYVATADGYIHKLSITTGRELSNGWPVRVTLLPSHERVASPTSIDGAALIVVTDGYDGDIAPYQGHVVSINRATGKIEAIWNSLCSNIDHLLDPAHGCPYSDSAIWGRSGAVIVPGSGDVLVATSNGVSSSTVSFNGRTNWSDSVLELSPGLKLLHNWTPTDQLHLTQDDLDLGSSSPVLLPGNLVLQAGKSGQLNLLNLKALDGTTGPAGPRLGGQLQTIDAPGTTDVFSEPAVWTSPARQTYVFVTTGAGTAAYRLSDRRLTVAWQDSTPGTSPVIAGGLLYVYDEIHGALLIRSPTSGREIDSLPVGQGHWNSPIVVGGRIILPVGNADAHPATGTLDIYHLPGR
jgi:outer membrane protein assembly factor BamB